MKVEPLSVGGVLIEEVEVSSLSDEDFVAVNAYDNLLAAERNPDDPPTPLELTRASYQNIPGFVSVRLFWARDPHGGLVATAGASFLRTEENRHLLQVGIDVHPDHRRKGIARELLGLVAGVAEAEGRSLVMSSTSDRVPAGEAFASRVGASPGSAVHVNRLLLSEVDRELVRGWVADGPGRAPGYSLVPVDGAYPEELIERVVKVWDVMNTAPRDDLDIEDHHWTAEQLREAEKSMLAAGTERWSLFARHDATGELVGYTEVYWNASRPKTVGQGDTGVHPDHRGHALGKWLKAAMLERVLAERSGAEDVRTGNADSNDAMLGINRQLGFGPFEAMVAWQVPLERVQAYLAGR